MNKDVKTFLEGLDGDRRAIAEAACSVVLDFAPEVEEKTAWAGIGYKYPDGNYICMVYPGKAGMNVMIHRGVMLEDPDGRLDGSGKNTRNYRVATLDDLDRDELTSFLAQQKALYDSGIRWE